MVVVPNSVMASREVITASETIRQWLVKWKGRSVEDTIWEDEFVL